jgi:hypothetical protein
MNWIGRTIVSQYGLVCDVLDVKDGELECRARHNARIWHWTADTVFLVTENGEMLEWQTGEIFGKVTGKNWDLYSDEQCRKMTSEEVQKEFE